MIHLIFILHVPFVSCDSVIQINNGPIREISIDAKNVHAFLGISYAEPPVGKLVPKS